MTTIDHLFIKRGDDRKRRNWRIREVLFDDMVATRVLLALAELLWAINLLWPGNTFDRAPYAGLAAVTHEEIWGLLFLVTAYVQWQIVVIGEFNCPPARLFAGWNATLWSFCMLTMYSTYYPPSAAMSGEIALAVASVWVFVRPFFDKDSKNARK